MSLDSSILKGRNERGAVIALVAMALIVVVILIAFVIEYGYLIIVKHEGQAAVDAAALSAVAGIPAYNLNGNTINSQILAERFNQTWSGPGQTSAVTVDENTVMHSSAAITFNTDVEFIKRQSSGGYTQNPPYTEADGVKVVRTYQVPPLFGKVLGALSTDVTVEAHAFVNGPRCFPVESPIVLLSPSCGNTNLSVSNCTTARCNMDFDVSFSNPIPDDNAAFWAPAGSSGSAQECSDLVSGAALNIYLCVGDQIKLSNSVASSCMHEMKQECLKNRCQEDIQWKVTVPVVSCANLRDASGDYVASAAVTGFARVGITRVDDQSSPTSLRLTTTCGDSVAGAPSGGGFCGFYASPFLE